MTVAKELGTPPNFPVDWWAEKVVEGEKKGGCVIEGEQTWYMARQRAMVALHAEPWEVECTSLTEEESKRINLHINVDRVCKKLPARPGVKSAVPKPRISTKRRSKR